VLRTFDRICFILDKAVALQSRELLQEEKKERQGCKVSCMLWNFSQESRKEKEIDQYASAIKLVYTHAISDEDNETTVYCTSNTSGCADNFAATTYAFFVVANVLNYKHRHINTIRQKYISLGYSAASYSRHTRGLGPCGSVTIKCVLLIDFVLFINCVRRIGYFRPGIARLHRLCPPHDLFSRWLRRSR
jgi:hypothetical protein